MADDNADRLPTYIKLHIEYGNLRASKLNALNLTPRQLELALICAAYWDRVEIVRAICKKDVDVDAIDDTEFKKTALMSTDDEDIARLLIERGASLDKRDTIGMTALMYNCCRNSRLMVEYLCTLGGIEAKDNNGITPLMYAARHSNLGIVKYLHETWGANLQSQDVDGDTALTFAARHKYLPVCQYLCARGTLAFRSLYSLENPTCSALYLRQYRRTQIFALVSRPHIGAQIGRIPNEIFRRILDILAGPK